MNRSRCHLSNTGNVLPMVEADIPDELGNSEVDHVLEFERLNFYNENVCHYIAGRIAYIRHRKNIHVLFVLMLWLTVSIVLQVADYNNMQR